MRQIRAFPPAQVFKLLYRASVAALSTSTHTRSRADPLRSHGSTMDAHAADAGGADPPRPRAPSRATPCVRVPRLEAASPGGARALPSADATPTPPRSALDIDGTACATQRFLEEVDEALDGVKATLRRDLGAVLSSLDELGEASAAFARETRAKTCDFEKTIEAHDRYAKELRDILGG